MNLVIRLLSLLIVFTGGLGIVLSVLTLVYFHDRTGIAISLVWGSILLMSLGIWNWKRIFKKEGDKRIMTQVTGRTVSVILIVYSIYEVSERILDIFRGPENIRTVFLISSIPGFILDVIYIFLGIWIWKSIRKISKK